MQLLATLTVFIDFSDDAVPVAQNSVAAVSGVQGGDVLDIVVCCATAVLYCGQVSGEEASLVFGLTILSTGHARDHILGRDKQKFPIGPSFRKTIQGCA